MKPSDIGLKEEVINKINGVLSRYENIISASVYGSRVRGNYKQYSDIDIALFGDLTYSLVYEIADELDSKYGAKVTAGFVREAADVGEARGRLRKD